MTREIVALTRPICESEAPRRCRKTAVVSIDGVYRCEAHRSDDYGIRWAALAIPIRWGPTSQKPLDKPG